MNFLDTNFLLSPEEKIALGLGALLALFSFAALGIFAGRIIQRKRQIRDARNIIMFGSPHHRRLRRLRLPKIHPLVWLIVAGVAANAYVVLEKNGLLSLRDDASANSVTVNRLPHIGSGPSRTANKSNGTYSGARVIEGRVTHVRDGDTIEVSGTPVRFSKLDCDELGTASGEKAKRRMAQLVSGEQLRCALSGRRSYDRMIGECTLSNGRDLGEEMIREGVCRRW